MKRVRKGKQARDKTLHVNDGNGQIWREGEDVRRRAQYFEQVLNLDDVRYAIINVATGFRMPLIRELNKSATSIEELMAAVNNMKEGKAPG